MGLITRPSPHGTASLDDLLALARAVSDPEQLASHVAAVKAATKEHAAASRAANDATAAAEGAMAEAEARRAEMERWQEALSHRERSVQEREADLLAREAALSAAQRELAAEEARHKSALETFERARAALGSAP